MPNTFFINKLRVSGFTLNVGEILGVYAGRDVVDELRRFSRRLVVATSPPQRSLLVATAPPKRILATCPAYETRYDLSVFTSAELLVRAA